MGTRQVDDGAVRLSPRELEIAKLVAEGLTNREIGARLFISERTVDGHLEHVREKLAVNTRAQVAAWVVREGDAAAVSIAAPVPITPAAPAGHVAPRRRLMARPRAWMATALVLAVLAAGVGLVRLLTPAPVIQTIAGVQCPTDAFPGGCGGADGVLATNSGLSRPSDVAAARDGTIYIAEADRVRRIDTNRTITTVAGGGARPLADGLAGTDVKLGFPNNITTDAKGNLYVLTNHDGVLEVWTVRSDHTIRLFATIGRSNSIDPLVWAVPLGGLAVSGDGTVYIADRAGNRVWAVVNGGEPFVFAGTGEAGFSGDRGAAAKATLYWPAGLAVGKNGDIYIADAENNRIRKVNALGVITTVAGNGRFFSGTSRDVGSAQQVRLKIPFGVAVRSDGAVFIADTGDSRLVELSVSGQIQNVAGTGISGFAGDDGPATDAELSGPEGVAVALTGNLLVADTENERVREVRPAP